MKTMHLPQTPQGGYHQRGMPAKPKLGQNFLNDTQAVERIANSLGDLTGRTVVEIGPGAGAITGALAARAAHVLAVELDPALAAHLRTQFDPARVTVLNQDVLHFDFAAAAAVAGHPLCVVGNLPYYITTDILLKLFSAGDRIEHLVLMVQKEVADRITAAPGSRDYGLLSATAQMYGTVQKLFELGPESFDPPPNVRSAVFRMKMQPRFDELHVDEPGFIAFLKVMFAQKRKTVSNNLKLAYDKAVAKAALARAEIAPTTRAEAISLEDMARLYLELKSVS